MLVVRPSTDLGRHGPTLVLVGLISYLLIYLVSLIRDLDNPFEYQNGQPGAADVNLEVLDATRTGSGRCSARWAPGACSGVARLDSGGQDRASNGPAAPTSGVWSRRGWTSRTILA